jgi:hypothetical protein
MGYTVYYNSLLKVDNDFIFLIFNGKLFQSQEAATSN